MPESESYFGDPKSKLPDFKHTIDLVGELFSLGFNNWFGFTFFSGTGGDLPQGGHLCAHAEAGSHYQVGN